jgi:hypothetical protein
MTGSGEIQDMFRLFVLCPKTPVLTQPESCLTGKSLTVYHILFMYLDASYFYMSNSGDNSLREQEDSAVYWGIFYEKLNNFLGCFLSVEFTAS